MFDVIIAILFLILGIVSITFTSKIAVKHSATLASVLGVSSLVIGITLVSIGTDISEIFNSIISCYLGHGDIDVGDSVGSVLTQLTLVFGLLPLLAGSFNVKRKEFLIIGSCEVLSLILIFTVVEKGYFTRLDALFMIGSLIFYLMVIYNVTKSDMLEHVNLEMEELEKRKNYKKIYLITGAIMGFIGVALSSLVIIESVLYISRKLLIHEYIISFLIISLGTSLPELSVDLTALRRKQYNIAIGDIIGSCIIDASFSIAIGQLLFPQSVTASLAIPTIIYTILASICIVIVVAKREIVDKKAGIFFITLYGLFYAIIFPIWIFS